MKPIYLLLFSSLILTTTRSFSQGSVCVTTEPVTGQITISWSLPGWENIDNISYYLLQWSNISGDSTNPNYIKFSNPSLVTTYTIPDINGNINRYYFRIYGQRIDGTAFEIWPPSNIYLTVTGIEKRVAKLTWNRDWSNSIGLHYVQRLDNGLWNTIYSIPNQEYENYSFNDTLTKSPCDTTKIEYRIIFEPEYGDCNSISNIRSGEVLGRFLPVNPLDQTVSIFHDPAGTYTGCPIVSWSKSPSKDVTGYIIYRKDPGFFAIDTIPSDSTQFIDKTVKGCSDSFTYTLAAIDSCGNISSAANAIAAHNIVIDTLFIVSYANTAYINWNSYDNMPGGLGGYIIYRQVNSDSFEALDTLAPDITSFYDNAQFINGYDYTYFIEAFSQSGTGFSSSCTKTVTYYDRETLFFMPNAFNPSGVNTKFRPVQSFVDINGFRMQIYDKWGQMIFATDDIIEGWDGNIKGSLAPIGVYVYYIRYKSLQGREYEKRGTFMLVN